MAVRKNAPRKKAPRKTASWKIAHRKIIPQKNGPVKLFYWFFVVVVDITLQLFIFKLFIVTSFRGESETPTTFTRDPRVNGIN